MTTAKRPLPSLRFVISSRGGRGVAPGVLFRLIPHTDSKGRVTPDLWCLPGGQLESTDALIERCKRAGWSWERKGSDGRRVADFGGEKRPVKLPAGFEEMVRAQNERNNAVED